MKPKFKVQVESYNLINEIESSWTIADYRNLLELLDFDEVNDIVKDEVFDYLALNINDLIPEEAAEIVLTYKLGKKLNENQIKQIAHDMVEEPLWQEYQDMSFHEELFKINALLFKLYNGKFPQPKAVVLELNIIGVNREGELFIENDNYDDESFICRILTSGMASTNIINRLFIEQLNGENFTEAEYIIWEMKSSVIDKTVKISVLTSENWVKDIKNVDSFESEAYSDKIFE